MRREREALEREALERSLDVACRQFAEGIAAEDENAAYRWWSLALLLVVAEPGLREVADA